MNNHFKCIGIVGHPRHPTALTTHEMLYRWLCTKGYEVIVEQQIAHELQLQQCERPGRWRRSGSWLTWRSWWAATAICSAQRGRWPATTLTLLGLTAVTSVF